MYYINSKENRKQFLRLPYFKNTQPHLKTPILLAKRKYSSFKLSKHENWQNLEQSKLSSSRRKQESLIMQKLKLKSSHEKSSHSSSINVSSSYSRKNSGSEKVSYVVSSKASRRMNQGAEDAPLNLPILVGTVEIQNFINGS